MTAPYTTDARHPSDTTCVDDYFGNIVKQVWGPQAAGHEVQTLNLGIALFCNFLRNEIAVISNANCSTVETRRNRKTEDTHTSAVLRQPHQPC